MWWKEVWRNAEIYEWKDENYIHLKYARGIKNVMKFICQILMPHFLMSHTVTSSAGYIFEDNINTYGIDLQ